MSKHIKKEEFEIENPILIFINHLAGGGLGKDLIKKCKDVPNLYTVKLPEEAETFYEDQYEVISNPKLRCIACGGDGTINWVMNLLSDLFSSDGSVKPPLAIIPLGTGNDMSNSIGWGTGTSSGSLKYIFDKINEIAKSKTIKMIDRWSITIADKDTPNDIQVRHRFVNYFSIGVDAGVTYEYAEMRAARNPSTRLGSFALYVPAGAHFLTDKTKLSQLAEIHLFGEEAEQTEKSDKQKKDKPKKDKKKKKNENHDNDDDDNDSENESHNNDSTHHVHHKSHHENNQNESHGDSHHDENNENANSNNNNNNDNSNVATNDDENVLNNYIDDENVFTKYPETIFKAKNSEQTITFLSSRNMYAGRLLWRGKHKADMSDGKFEILINKGATRLAMTNLGFVLPRSHGQARGARLETTQKIYYQVDGEAFMFPKPAIVKLCRDGFYPFIVPINPTWRVPMSSSDFKSMPTISYDDYNSCCSTASSQSRHNSVSHFPTNIDQIENGRNSNDNSNSNNNNNNNSSDDADDSN